MNIEIQMYSNPDPRNEEERIIHGLHRRVAVKHTVAQDAYGSVACHGNPSSQDLGFGTE